MTELLHDKLTHDKLTHDKIDTYFSSWEILP